MIILCDQLLSCQLVRNYSLTQVLKESLQFIAAQKTILQLTRSRQPQMTK